MSRLAGRPAPRVSALTALLDALEQDLMSAPAAEVQEVLRETGRARASACRAMRLLLDEALAASEDGPLPQPSPGACTGTGLHRH